MFWRKPSQTQTQQLLTELGESYGHLKQAAGHVAGGAAEKLTPPYDRARNAAARGWYTARNAFAPIYEQMKEGAANARKGQEVKKHRWPIVVGLLAAGALAGAAGAVIAKRRRAAQDWDEYEPLAGIDELDFGDDLSALGSDVPDSEPAEATAPGSASGSGTANASPPRAATSPMAASPPQASPAAHTGQAASSGAGTPDQEALDRDRPDEGRPDQDRPDQDRRSATSDEPSAHRANPNGASGRPTTDSRSRRS